MSNVPLSELKKTHGILSRMLKSRVCSPFTLDEVRSMKAALEREIAELEAEQKNKTKGA